MKKCGSCKTLKEETEFYKDKTRCDNLEGICKTCKKVKPYYGNNTNMRANYIDSNRGKINKYYRDKYSESELFRIKSRMRNHVNRTINNNKAKRTDEIIGISWHGLQLHLAVTAINNGYGDYDDYDGTKWHIDHIKPLDAFDLTIENERNQANHYTNLQILSVEDNLKKSNKY